MRDFCSGFESHSGVTKIMLSGLFSRSILSSKV